MTTENSLRHYELLYIIPVKYTVDELPGIQNKIKALLAEHGSAITYEEDFGKKKLSYPIKRVYHGYYFLTEFNLDPEALKKLNSALRLDQDILRHLIVAKVERTSEQIRLEKERRAKAEAEEEERLKEKISAPKAKTVVSPTVAAAAKPSAKGKVSIEELDKKLDELIDESIL